MTARRAITAGLILLLAAVGSFTARHPTVVEAHPGRDLQEIVDAAPAGAVVRLSPGEYAGPLLISTSLTVEGPGAEIEAPQDERTVITVAADDVTLVGLSIAGGATGIMVREAEGAVLRDVTVAGSDMHGIEVVDASAQIIRAEVSGLTDEFAQGIEIRNSDGRPDSSVTRSVVTGGQEGIVSHVSEVVISDNSVSDTTMRAIAVTEMSDGVVRDNRISGATGTALYCGDMSRCQFERNTSDEVAAADLGNSAAGWGLVVTYHAVASSEDDDVGGAAGHSFSSLGGRIRSSTPLEIGAGAKAVVPVGLSTAAALAVLYAIFLLCRRVSFSDRDVTTPSWEGVSAALVGVALLLVAVQSFHMFEHVLQVYRVRVDGIPSRGGLAGPRVETEWVHFLYNAAVLATLGFLVFARRRGWRPPGSSRLGDRLLAVAVVVQSYHMIEHAVKLMQHLTGGAKVNDGILGGILDLVLFHYALNLIVYLAVTAAVAAYLWRKLPAGHLLRKVQPVISR